MTPLFAACRRRLFFESENQTVVPLVFAQLTQLKALGGRFDLDQEQRYLQCVLRFLSSHDGAHAHALTRA